MVYIKWNLLYTQLSWNVLFLMVTLIAETVHHTRFLLSFNVFIEFIKSQNPLSSRFSIGFAQQNHRTRLFFLLKYCFLLIRLHYCTTQYINVVSLDFLKKKNVKSIKLLLDIYIIIFLCLIFMK